MSVLGTAASLAKKKAELAALNNVTLPRVYQSIGRKIASLAKLPPALAEHVTRIRQLEAAIAAGPVDSSASAEGGFAAKAKQLAQKAAKATADAATGIQINSAYTTLGREAVRQFGEKAIPKELTAELSALNAQQQALVDEIRELEESHSGGVVTPKRLVLAGMLIAVLFGGVVVLRGVGSLFGFGGQKAPDWREALASSRKSRGEEALAPHLRQAREDRESRRRKEMQDTLASELQTALDTWNSKADDQIKRLEQEHQQFTAAVRDSRLEPTALAGLNKNAETVVTGVRQLRESCSTELQKQFDDSKRRFAKALADAPTTSDTDGLSRLSGQIVREFYAQSDAAVARLRDTTEQSGRQLGTLAREPQRLQKELREGIDKELQAAVAEWAKGISSLSSLASEKQLNALQGPNNPEDWKREYEEAAGLLSRFLNEIIDEQRRQASHNAEVAAAAVSNGDSEQQARNSAQQMLRASLAAARTAAQGRRTDTVRRLVEWHASAMKQQSDREESERAAKELASRRTYEGPATLTDDELIEVIRLAPDISDLALAQSQRLTDKCMPAVASLKNLRELYLSNRAFHTDTEPVGITAKGLSLLKGKKLNRLTIPDQLFNTDDGFLAYVHCVADIRSCEVYWRAADVLRLDNARVSEEVLQGLLDVPHIYGLTLPSRISDRGLEVLQKFPELQRVDFFLTDKVTDAGLRSLAKCKKLRMIIMWLPDGVVDVHVTPEAIRALSGMNLAWFVVPQAMHTEEFFEPVLNTLSPVEVQFRDGEPLELMRRELCLVSPKEAFDPRVAANNPDRLNREVFSMWHWPCTPTVLRACEGKAGVEDLEIRECSVDEDALAAVGRMPDLKELLILKSDVSGRGLGTIAQAKSLKEVEINQCPKFSGAGVSALAECVALEKLIIVEAPLLNDEDLLKLAKCKTLKVLAVSGSQASNALLVKLQNLMPECHISINP